MERTDEETRELKAHIREMVERARKHHDKWRPVYDDGRAYVFDDQLKDVAIKEGWEHVQINKIFPAVLQQQSAHAQRNTMVIPLPWEEGDEAGAEFWKGQLQWQYEKGIDVPGLLMRGIIDGKTHGHWVVRTYWEPEDEWNSDKNEWSGAVKVKLERPELICFDPDGDPLDPEWAIGHERVPVERAKVLWPDWEEEIEASIRGDRVVGGGAGVFADLTAHLRRGSRLDDTGKAAGHDAEGRLTELLAPGAEDPEMAEGSKLGAVTILHVFMKDHTRVEETIEEPYSPERVLDEGIATLQDNPQNPEAPQLYVGVVSGEELKPEDWPADKRTVNRPLYPHGRYVVMLGEEILEDRAWEYRHWSYVRGVNLLLPHTWHGLNAVEMVKGLQNSLNTMGRHFTNYVTKFGDPVTMVEEGAVVNRPNNEGVTDKLKCGPGALWKLSKGGIDKVKRVPPPPIGAGTLQIFDVFSDEAKDQTGVQDVALGKQAKGDMSATESRGLQVSSQSRNILEAILVDRFTIELMQTVQELCQRNMTPGQLVRVSGEKAMMRAMSQEALDARFDLRLKVTSEQPYDQGLRREQAKELYALLGLPFIEELLDEYDDLIGDKDELLQKIGAYQALLAAMEQQKQQGEADAQASAEQASAAK